MNQQDRFPQAEWARLQWLVQERRWAEAEQVYRLLLEYYGEQPNLLLEMAWVQAWQGKFRSSAETFRKVAEREPVNPKGWIGLVQVLSWDGRLREATEAALQGWSYTGDPVLEVETIRLYYWQGRFAEGWRLLSRRGSRASSLPAAIEREITHLGSNHLLFTVALDDDSLPQSTLSQRGRFRLNATDHTRLEVVFERLSFRERSELFFSERSGQHLTAEATYKIPGRPLEIFAAAGFSRVEEDVRFLYRAGFDWFPGSWRIFWTHHRGSLLTPKGVRNGLDLRQTWPRIRFENDRMTLELGFLTTLYSDQNRVDTAHGYFVHEVPGLAGFRGGYHFSYGDSRLTRFDPALSTYEPYYTPIESKTHSVLLQRLWYGETWDAQVNFSIPFSSVDYGALFRDTGTGFYRFEAEATYDLKEGFFLGVGFRIWKGKYYRFTRGQLSVGRRF